MWSPDFTQNEAINLTVSYLSILNEEKSRRSKYFEFNLDNNVLDRRNLDHVFELLVKEHLYMVYSTTDGTFLIRSDVCIESCI